MSEPLHDLVPPPTNAKDHKITSIDISNTE